ncbi:MAG: HAMP domain-containing protein [Anaerolineales bacterium]|nr:HAMP domain-containing protein [Anaerolineales bacterium]
MQSSVHEIRKRLLLLLVQAFAIVLVLSFSLFVIIIGYYLSSSSIPVGVVPIANMLEGYYLSHGSWEGVETAFESGRGLHAFNPILLDNDYHVIVDSRLDAASTVGSRYEPQRRDMILELEVRGEPVGYLVVTASARFGIVRGILFPVGIISTILAMFLIVAAILLARRFVNPLADVIYAARQVASGNLKTRISTKGPQDLRSLSESFNEMASSLERSDRERRGMLADIAHELRTPLSVLRGRLEGIVDGIYSENGTEVSTALEQTYLLQRLVDDLHLLTLAESRQLPFDKQNVDIGDLIERALDMFSAEAEERNVSLSFPEKEGDLSVLIDPQRFEQVLSNLIGNSLRYVPEGGRVWVTASETPEGVRIAVKDNGSGIPPEDLPFIFDRFWRKEKSRARLSGGTGLGLAIAKQLIEAQGGTIEAGNLPEGGLQVVIRLQR